MRPRRRRVCYGPNVRQYVFVGTSLEQFKASLGNTAARRYLGLNLSDDEAVAILNDDHATTSLYMEWLRQRALRPTALGAGAGLSSQVSQPFTATARPFTSPVGPGSPGEEAPKPGWYADMSGSTRWWDGRRWLEEVSAPHAPAKPSNAMSSWGLGLGIAAMFLNFLLVPGVLAIVFGSVGVNRSASRGTGRGAGLWGIWLGAIGTVVALVRFVLALAYNS